jgi:hypothetical protein
MKITIESTTEIVDLNNGVKARLWEGTSERGVKIHCLITRIAVHKDDDCSQFEAELTEHAHPQSGERVFPLRMIL